MLNLCFLCLLPAKEFLVSDLFYFILFLYYFLLSKLFYFFNRYGVSFSALGNWTSTALASSQGERLIELRRRKVRAFGVIGNITEMHTRFSLYQNTYFCFIINHSLECKLLIARIDHHPSNNLVLLRWIRAVKPHCDEDIVQSEQEYHGVSRQKHKIYASFPYSWHLAHPLVRAH